MATLKTMTIQLEIGQEILIGSNFEPATITKIEFNNKTGEVNLNTTKGPRRALTFRLKEKDKNNNPADKYR